MNESYQEVKRSPTRRFFMVAFLLLIVLVSVFSWLGYSNMLNLQGIQNTLKLEQDNLKNKYSSLQNDYDSLQNETEDINAKISELQSLNETLTSDYQNLESKYYEILSEYSNLQVSYDKIINGYLSAGSNSSFNYLIFTDSRGISFAENGRTGVIDYSGSSATQVIQSCINKLSDSGGRIVFAGKIILNEPIIIQKSMSKGLLELCGLGPSTQLIVNQGSDGIHVFGDQAFGYGGPFHVSIKDLVLTTELSPLGKFMDKGIYIKNWFGVNIENVMVFYANHSGIFIEDSANVRLNNVYVEGGGGVEYGGSVPLQGVGIWLRGSKDCYFHQTYSDTNKIGFLFDSNPITNNMPRSVFLSQCEATYNDQNGVSISYSDGIIISESLVEGSNGDGIVLVDSFRVTIVNSIIIGNVGNGLFVNSQKLNMTQSEIIISTSTINSNNQNGIVILSNNSKSISHLSIESCTIINSGTGARDNLDQPNLFDGIKIRGDLVTGGTCEHIKVLNCYLGNRDGTIQTQRYGIYSQDNSDFIQLFYNSFFDNIADEYSLSGFNNSIGDNFSS